MKKKRRINVIKMEKISSKSSKIRLHQVDDSKENRDATNSKRLSIRTKMKINTTMIRRSPSIKNLITITRLLYDGKKKFSISKQQAWRALIPRTRRFSDKKIQTMRTNASTGRKCLGQSSQLKRHQLKTLTTTDVSFRSNLLPSSLYFLATNERIIDRINSGSH